MQAFTSPQALSWKVRLGILLPLLAMASIPLFVYFQFEHEHILLWMWLILIAVQIVLSLRTARLAIGMMSSIRKRDGKHIQLTLTEAEAKTFPRDVLKAVMRATWIDHVMLALPRLGVALAFMQYFHASPLWVMRHSNSVFNIPPFLYYSHDYHAGFPSPPIIYPDMIQVTITIIILLLFAIFEGLLVIGLATLCSNLIQKYKATILTITSRLLIVFTVIIIFIQLTHIISMWFPLLFKNPSLGTPTYQSVDTCESVYRTLAKDGRPQLIQEIGQKRQESGQCKKAYQDLMFLRTVEGTQVTITSFLDQGMLLASNILRPIILDEELMTDPEFQYIYYGYRYDREWNWQVSYVPFVIRNILSALLAFAIYGVIIWSSLRIARHRLVSVR